MRTFAWLLLLGAVGCHHDATPPVRSASAARPELVPLPGEGHRTEVGDRVRATASPFQIPAPGAKLTLINYFATWCGSSQRWMREADRLEQKYRARGLVVVGVAHWPEDTPAEAEAFARTNGATYPIVFDAGRRIAMTVHPLTWGQSLVGIDPEGVVRIAHVGSYPEAMADVDAQLDALLPR